MKRTLIRSALVALVALVVSLQACNLPSKADYDALEAKAEESAAALEKADAAKAELELEVSKIEKSKAASESRVEALKSAQGEIAVQLAASSGQLRDALTAAMRRLDRDIEAEVSQAAAVGATLADLEEKIGKLAIDRERASRKLDEALAQADMLDEQGRQAIAGALEGIKGLGQVASNLGVPGAGAISSQLVDGLGGLALGLIPAGGVALNYRRQRNAGRRAMATTERIGLEAIATDPAAKAAAKAAMKADKSAAVELAKAKALA